MQFSTHPDLEKPIAFDPFNALSALPFAVLAIERDSSIAYMNGAAEQFFEQGATGLRGRRLNQLLPTDSPLFSLIAQSIAGQTSVAEYDVSISFPRGRPRNVAITAAPMMDGSSLTVVSLHEQSIARRINNQIAHRNAARSVTGLAELLAHEVKNPLAGIKGAAQLLESGLGDEDRVLTRMIVEESDRVAALLDRMEGFAGGARLVLSPVNIHEVLDHCLGLAAASYGAHLVIRRQYDPSLPLVNGHRDLLIQSFINIIKNASEATDKNAELVIKTSYSRGRRLSLAASDGGSHVPVQVDIIDNGRGIPEDIRNHIFDPFVSGRNGGSGLGLTMVASVVADHGGMIEVDSTAGRTAFRMNFPVAESGKPASSPPKPAKGSAE